MTWIMAGALFLTGTSFDAADAETAFTTAKAKEARKTYEKAVEKAKAEYEAKLRKARADYSKTLAGALKDAKKAKAADEAGRIEKEIDALKKENAAGEKAAGGREPSKKTKAPEKGPGGITYEGGSGESIEDAIIIKGAKDEKEGVAAEYHWVKVHYPKYEVGSQAVKSSGGKSYDVLNLTGPDGETKSIHFDISDFFGKF
jgi:hypothetical protein